MEFSLTKEQFSTLFPAYLCMNSEGQIIAVGPSLSRLYGKSLKGKNLYDTFHIERPLKAKNFKQLTTYNEQIIMNASWEHRVKVRGYLVAQGQVYYLLLSYLPDISIDPDDMPLTIDDFSPLDSALDAYFSVCIRESMMKDVQELAQKLEVAKVSAEMANKTKSQFLANISHELRTPLNAVIGFAEIIKVDKLKEKSLSAYEKSMSSYKEYAGYIHTSGKHLLAIINDILDISKIESNQATLYEESVELSGVLEAAVILVDSLITKKKLTFKNEINLAGQVFVNIDTQRFKQAVVNLLSNAIKFTAEKGTIGLKTQLDNSGNILVVVYDSGIGMRQENLDRVTQPFIQVDDGFNKEFDGTGLGLALVKAFIEMHQGRLILESDEGVGTRAILQLPEHRCTIEKSE